MFQYITTTPEIFRWHTILKDTRLSVEFILELFASGATQDEILQNVPIHQAGALRRSTSLRRRIS